MEAFTARRTWTIVTLLGLGALLSGSVALARHPESVLRPASASRVWDGELTSVTAVSRTEYWMAGYYTKFPYQGSPYLIGLTERWDGTKGGGASGVPP